MTALYTAVLNASIAFGKRKKISDSFFKSSEYWKPDRKDAVVLDKGLFCCMAKSWLFVDSKSKNENITEKNNIYAILNGYLTNSNNLCSELSLSFQSSDTEILVSSFIKWGAKCVGKLEGSFCFIIWNADSKQLFCSVDHFSTRSLFYAINEKGILVTNEPNAFFTADWTNKEISEKALIEAISDSTYPIKQEPLIVGINKLAPATSLIFDNGEVEEIQYWQSCMLNDKMDLYSKNIDCFSNNYTDTIKNAVLNTLDFSYPVATELSEGLDSSGIAGIAATHNSEQTLHTLSHICLDPHSEKNAEWMPYYAPILNTLKRYPNLAPLYSDNPMEYTEDLDEFVENIGGAFFINDATLLRPKIASRVGAKIILTGVGGDHCASSKASSYLTDLFYHRQWKRLHRIIQRKMPKKRHQLKLFISLALKVFLPRVHFKRLIKNRNSFEGAYVHRLDNNLVKSVYFNKYQTKKLLLDGLRRHTPITIRGVHERNLNDMDLERRLLSHELAARFYRCEYRYPLLDISVLKLAYNAPFDSMFTDNLDRAHYRNAIKDYVTEEILLHDKRKVANPIHLLEEIFSAINYDKLDKSFSHSYLNLNDLKKEDKSKIRIKRIISSIIPYSKKFKHYKIIER